jgi:potassium-transporting ATPase ATP-binding subunit
MKDPSTSQPSVTDARERQKLARRRTRRQRLFDPAGLRPALVRSVVMLDPRRMARNPVMATCEAGAALTTLIAAQTAWTGSTGAGFQLVIAVLLWLTVLFANFAEAVAEARGKAQADTLRATRHDTPARRRRGERFEEISSTVLRPGDVVVVRAGELIPADGEILRGAASIDESAITGESAPVVREAGGDRSGVTGGTRVLSDEIEVGVTAEPGQSFLDRIIALVEGAVRQKTPNEIALTVVLSGFTLAFLVVTTTLAPIGRYFGLEIPVPTLVALLVCLIPTTIGALLPAIGLAGMDRALAANLLAKSGKAVEIAGDVDTLLIDKTGTITQGNRRATRWLPLPGVGEEELAAAAVESSFADATPEGRSIVELGTTIGLRPQLPPGAEPVPFTAETRMSGVDLPSGESVRKGAANSVAAWVRSLGGEPPAELKRLVEEVAEDGGTPVVVARGSRVLGVVGLADVLKPGIAERFGRLRRMGLRVVMVTGDNPITAAVIARQAGVDDFIAEARPEDKLAYIRREQESGRLVAMMGDGTNDAPALAQADLGVAMNAGTQAAKEASNMIDLDSDPTKLIEVIEVGKQLLMTRGALTTFSFANDIAKYFAIVPAIFVGTLPAVAVLDVMRLTTPASAILSAVIFNAAVIPLLIPIALRGVRYRPIGAGALLRHNLLVYGLGGVALPFVAIKAIDLALAAVGLAS